MTRVEQSRPAVRVVAVGASAGGVASLQGLVSRLPADLPAAVLVVLHMPRDATSALPDILARRSALPVARAEDRDPLRPGTILVAPPDRHLLVERGRARLSAGPRVNNHRPAVDPLLESAAAWCGPRALGVLLSGTLDDGVAGLAAVRDAGGLTAVQDPSEAAFAGMPLAAIEAGVTDHVLPLEGVAGLVRQVTHEGTADMTPYPDARPHRPDGAPPDGARGPGSDGRPGDGRNQVLAVTDDAHEHRPDFRQAALSCPSCGGTLWESDADGVGRFECRVGHRYSPASLVEAQGDALEDALWAAHRALLERADLARRMATRTAAHGGRARVLRYLRMADEADARARVLHAALGASFTSPGDEGAPPDARVDGDGDGRDGDRRVLDGEPDAPGSSPVTP
jgi:two-component system chemotaxis response regulator CheB